MTTWHIDPAHSEISFKVKHLMVSTVKGMFTRFEGTVEAPDEDYTKAVISFSAKSESISTNQAQRDEHLKSADFFEVEKFPILTFSSTLISKLSDTEYKVEGDLTMHGVTKEVAFNATMHGIGKGMDGVEVAGVEAHGILSRKDFGLVWNAPLEAGGVVVSDEVGFEFNLELKENK
jgi:polyisoprenoid-binding protein YceI